MCIRDRDCKKMDEKKLKVINGYDIYLEKRSILEKKLKMSTDIWLWMKEFQATDTYQALKNKLSKIKLPSLGWGNESSSPQNTNLFSELLMDNGQWLTMQRF